MPVRNLDKLAVYRYADRLAIEVCRCTASMPVAEQLHLAQTELATVTTSCGETARMLAALLCTLRRRARR